MSKESAFSKTRDQLRLDLWEFTFAAKSLKPEPTLQVSPDAGSEIPVDESDAAGATPEIPELP
ncbi:MAG: hypothetical protein ACOYM3_08560 [Terrimicrobiaceae bacterium]